VGADLFERVAKPTLTSLHRLQKTILNYTGSGRLKPLPEEEWSSPARRGEKLAATVSSHTIRWVEQEARNVKTLQDLLDFNRKLSANTVEETKI
jgi:hypothetical protein